AHANWSMVLRTTFVPHIEWSSTYLATFVGILGTSISPYLFFWQAAQEGEEDRKMGRTTVKQRQGATDEELRRSRTDVVTGMFFFKPDHVLHHSHHGGYAERSRTWADYDGPASCRSVAAARRRRSVPAVHAGCDWRRDVRCTRAGGLDRIRHR